MPFACHSPRGRKLFRSSAADDDPGTIESIERAAAAAARASQKKKKSANRPPALRDIPKLAKEMLMQNSKSTTLKEAQENAIMAAKKLYELCDVGHKSNREVMVASGQYDVIGPLTQCLLHEPIYHHSHDNDTPGASSSSTIVTLPHQQPRIEGDGIDSNNTKSENDHTIPSSIPITPTDQINAETKRDDGDENAAPPASAIAAATPTTNTNTTTTRTPNNQKTIARKQQHRVDEKLHFVCLTLNNLSIPHDNKRVMVRERGAKRLLGNLCKIVASGKKEAHLCCIILMNLTFYEPGLTIIGQFSPTSKTPNSIESSSSFSSHGNSTHNGDNSSHNTGGTAKKALKTTTTILKRAADAVTKQRKLTPLENPKSLLRILQDLLTNVERGTSDFRWAFGLLANLSRHPENALLIGLTGIPRVAIENLRLSKIPSKRWATNSLEDFSLYFLLHMAEASPNGLKDALEVVVPIMNGDDCPEEAIVSNSDGDATTSEDSNKTNQSKNLNNSSSRIDKKEHRGYGIQSLKATMVCAFLGLEWKHFPDHGVIAAGTVSELMGNTFERVGKKQVYTDNDFALRTAVSAYAALAKAAARADSNEVVLSKGKATNSASAETVTNGSATASITPSSNSSCVHTKVMALPTSVALLFQIINAIALHWGEENNTIGSSSGHGSSGNESDAYHWDIKAGELAVAAIMSLLPALLEGTGDNASSKHHSMATQQACADLSKIFVFFSKKTNSISIMARSAEVAEKLTHSASGSALPLLEASYDLCRNFGTHRVKKNFL